ncbi:MAG: hypothetical protein IPN90_09295 [Elusimicrobia bacterium]|nr:hypothetical protein [Elusimicrobiota bacterium]
MNSKSNPIAVPVTPLADPWRPSWMWHLKVLAGIYIFLVVFYFVVDHVLARLPQPYRLRDVPMEMTPWLKK